MKEGIEFNKRDKKEVLPQEYDRTIQDQLLKVFKDSYPEIINRSLEDVEKREKRIGFIDSELFDKESLDAIKRFDVDVSLIKINGQTGRYEIDLSETNQHVDIPEGYAYKGGAARAVLLRVLGIDVEAEPRDFDIVRLSEKEPFVGADDYFSQEYMADDYEFGDGVEVVRDQDGYFNSRDLTINEILVTGEKIEMTLQGLQDTIRHILRITPYEIDRARVDYGDKLPHKLMAKTLRLYSESIERYGEEKAFLPEEGQSAAYEEVFITPFYIGVHLDRAFQQGDEVAEKYVKSLKRSKQIPDHINSARELAFYINRLMNHEPFYYRYAPISQIELENDWYENHLEE